MPDASLTVYGLKNCDTCRKALRFLKDGGVGHSFVDVRADGVTRERIASWAEQVGWEVLLNRRGTTWRGLDEADKADVDAAKAVDLMAAHPALIKRPVIEREGAVHVGFTNETKSLLTS
ncbi:MAG: arsenate reductase [Hyphomicrobiales bacterium]